MNKKLIVLSIVGLVLIGIIAGRSFSYFSTANREGEENVVKSGTMALLFTDGPQIIADKLAPGEYIEKTFTVKNTGNVNTTYDVSLSNIVNAFIDKTDLVYTLTSNDGGYNTTNEVQVPSVDSKIVSNKIIVPNSEHNYTLKIKFVSKQTIQNVNMGKTFSGTIQISSTHLSEAWDGNTEEVIPDGNVYSVSNPKQLAWISEQVYSGEKNFDGEKVVLTSDIDMGANFDSQGNLLNEETKFTPIGASNAFYGDFDGANYTIYNLYVSQDTNYAGLIGKAFGKEVKDLTVANSYIKGPIVVGVIGGNTSTTNNPNAQDLNIDNVKSLNNVIIATGLNAGGVVGQHLYGSITNCYSNSTVIVQNPAVPGIAYAGGIVGYGAVDMIANNINDGSVTSTSWGVGGIIGASYQKIDPITIQNNINNGTVQGEDKWIGGIVGITSKNAYIKDNINNGEVKTSKGAFRVGGIIGNGNDGVKIINNINYGNIDGMGDGTKESYGTGGIAGTFGHDSDNSSDLTAYIYNNHNKGNVKGNLNAGGVIGNLYGVTPSYLAVKNVLNEGNVEAVNGYAGGIIGVDDNNTSTAYVTEFISNAYNKGTIKGINAAGLVGRNVSIKNGITIGNLQGTTNDGVISYADPAVNISNVYYPNKYTSSYGTAIDISTLSDTTLSNVLGAGFKVSNGNVQLYKANVVIENKEVTSCTYTNDVIE